MDFSNAESSGIEAISRALENRESANPISGCTKSPQNMSLENVLAMEWVEIRILLESGYTPKYLRDFSRELYDRATGEELWRAERPEAKSSHCTPILAPGKDGADELILPGSFFLDAYDPATGKKKWFASGLCFEMKSVPVMAGGLVFGYLVLQFTMMVYRGIRGNNTRPTSTEATSSLASSRSALLLANSI